MNTVEKTRELQPTIDQQTVLANEVLDVAEIRREAMLLIDQHKQINHDSKMPIEEHNNSYSALMEELTASGHLSSLEFVGDMDEVNQQTLTRLLNATLIDMPNWEMKRRFHEIVEELTIHRAWSLIQEGEIDSSTIILTFSDYPEECPEQTSHNYGYRSLNYKGMVRATQFKKDDLGRFYRNIEQVSRSSSNNKASERFIEHYGGVDGEIVSTQMFVSGDEFPDGVVDVIQVLDYFGGTKHGNSLDSVEAQLRPDYHELRERSAEIEKQIQGYASRLEAYEIELNQRYLENEISYNEKLHYYHKKRKSLVDSILLLAPEYARDARGALSAKYYEQASLAMVQGNIAERDRLFASALYSADPRAAAACGGNGSDPNNESGLDKNGLTKEQRKMLDIAEEESDLNWGFNKRGVCRIESCTTRPGKTWVGPCDVCEKCQKKFDDGKDPTKDYVAPEIEERKFELIVPKFLQKIEGEENEQLAA